MHATLAQLEHTFQISTKKLARECLVGGYLFRAFDRGRNASGTQHLNEAARGIRKGTPDTETVQNGFSCNVELKQWGKKHLKAFQPTDAQEQEMQALRDAGAVAGCAWSHAEVLVYWRMSGFVLHPLADEYAAARDRKFALLMSPDADGVVKKPRGVGRRMVEKPQAATLRKMAAMRARTMC